MGVVVKEVIAGMDDAKPAARRHRYMLLAYLAETQGHGPIASVLQNLYRCVIASEQ